MNHFINCTIFLLIVFTAAAQPGSAGKYNFVRDAVTAKRNETVNFRPDPAVYPYLSFRSDSMQANSKKPVVSYRYKYVTDKNHPAVLNVTGLLLLGYFGYKTNHPYYYRPAEK